MESRNRKRGAARTREAEVEAESEAENDSRINEANVDPQANASWWQPEGDEEAIRTQVTVIAALAWLDGDVHRELPV